jgi:outer membrane beta-barrel protein
VKRARPHRLLVNGLAALALALLAPAGPARAAEADAFEGKVKPISGQLHRKAGRLELTPEAQISLADAFFTKTMIGAKATWHVAEWLSVGASMAAGMTRPTGSTQVCPPNQGCQPATPAQLAAVPGEIKMKAGAELGFAPVYAKLNVMGEKVIHFDLSLLAGPDWISYRQVLPPPALPDAAVSPGTASAIGGHVGLGTRVFLSDWGALRLELKDYFYRVPVGGQKKLEQQLFVELGFSFFLPRSSRAP